MKHEAHCRGLRYTPRMLWLRIMQACGRGGWRSGCAGGVWALLEQRNKIIDSLRRRSFWLSQIQSFYFFYTGWERWVKGDWGMIDGWMVWVFTKESSNCHLPSCSSQVEFIKPKFDSITKQQTYIHSTDWCCPEYNIIYTARVFLIFSRPFLQHSKQEISLPWLNDNTQAAEIKCRKSPHKWDAGKRPHSTMKDLRLIYQKSSM